MAEEEATIQEQLDAIKDSPEVMAMLNAHGKTVLEANSKDIIGKAKGEAFGHLDAIAKDVLGVDRDRSTKTTDFYKPLLEELLDLRKNKGATSEDVEAAVSKLKNEHNAQIEIMKGVNSELETKNAELLSNGTKRDIAAVISKELQGKTFKAHYTEGDLKMLVGGKTNQIVSDAKMEDGVVVFYGADGKKIRDEIGLPITAAKLVEREFSDMYQVKAAGGGANPPKDQKAHVHGEEGKEKIDMSNIIATIKTRDQFYKAATEALQAMAIEYGSEKYNKLYKKAMQEYGYNDLPIK